MCEISFYDRGRACNESDPGRGVRIMLFGRSRNARVRLRQNHVIRSSLDYCCCYNSYCYCCYNCYCYCYCYVRIIRRYDAERIVSRTRRPRVGALGRYNPILGGEGGGNLSYTILCFFFFDAYARASYYVILMRFTVRHIRLVVRYNIVHCIKTHCRARRGLCWRAHTDEERRFDTRVD